MVATAAMRPPPLPLPASAAPSTPRVHSTTTTIELPPPSPSASSSTTLVSASTSRKNFGDEDSQFIEDSSRPSKRRKVSFDSTVRDSLGGLRMVSPKLPSQPAVPISIIPVPVDLVIQDVRDALTGIFKEGAVAYDKIINIFQPSPDSGKAPNHAEQTTYLRAFNANTSLFTKSNSSLLRTMLDSDWLGREREYYMLFRTFLKNLVTTQGALVGVVLQSHLERLRLFPRELGAVPGVPALTSDELLNRVMASLRDAMRLVPSCNQTVLDLIPKTFPSTEGSKRELVWYAKNLLIIVSNAWHLRNETLETILERIVRIDVQIQTTLDDLNREDEEEEVTFEGETEENAPLLTGDHAATAEGFESDDDDDDFEDDDEPIQTSRAKKIRAVKEDAAKVDALMALLFQHFESNTANSSDMKLKIEFELIWNQWEDTILPARRSRHTQFLLFHYGQKLPDLSELVIENLKAIVANHDKAYSDHTRQDAAAYLASFIARGARLTTLQVRTLFESLGRTLRQRKLEDEHTCNGPDLNRFPMIYTLFQMMIYIFCFRWRELIADPGMWDVLDEAEIALLYEHKGFTWMDEVKGPINLLAFSKFNPLKVCHPDIVNEFAKISNHLGFIYVYSKMESNKSVQLAATSTMPLDVSGAGDQTRMLQLEAYFPFDPYRLPLSKGYLAGDYVDWTPVPGLEDDEDEDEDEDEEDEE